MNEAKEFLMQVSAIDRRIMRFQTDIADIRGRLALRGLTYDRDRVQTSPDDTMADAFSQIEALERKQARKIAELKRTRYKITLMIGELPEPYAELLNLRYCYCQRLDVVAKNMGYSFEWIRHLHGEALDKFGKKYETEIQQWLKRRQ